MIRITKIAGESFDLETRQELPKALVLSNGRREYLLYVDDETAKAVLELMLETVEQRVEHQRPAPAPVPSAPSKKNGKNGRAHVAPPPEPESALPDMAQVGEAPEPEADWNSGMEPGEEYNDPSTGAESL